MGGSKKVTVGFKYSLGMHMVFCHGPIDNISKIKFDGEKVAWTGSAGSGTITINQPNLFGGESREGGVVGDIDIQSGSDTQPRNPYLQSVLGAAIPAFRGVFALVFKQVYLGMNPYLKAMSVRGTRIQTLTSGLPQWNSTRAAIGPDLNPAHLLRECLTDADWGMGYPTADIDDTSFTTAAQTMFDEGMGISLLWDRSMPLDEFIALILKHIDGSLYVSRTTGKFVLKLSRNDYTLASLPVYGEAEIERISDYKRTSVGELINSVSVKYWDTIEEREASVTVQDITLVARQGGVIATTLQFPGFTNSTIANKIASRELQSLSTPLVRCTIYFNRTASQMNIGEVFKLNWPKLGVANLVLRVVNIELGELSNNLVKVTAIQDIFASSFAVYAPTPVTLWTNPIQPPTVPAYNILREATYWDMARALGDNEASALPATAAYILASCSRPSGASINAQIGVYNGGPPITYIPSGFCNFMPVALTAAAIDLNQTVIPFTAGLDMRDVVLRTYAIIDNEYMSVTAIDLNANTITVLRGVIDTTPRQHAINTPIYFAEEYFGSTEEEYAQSEGVIIKLLPVTPAGVLPEASASTLNIALVARQNKPYLPGALRINGVYPPTEVWDLYGPMNLLWSPRNRLTQTVDLIGQQISGFSPEVGATYNFEVRSVVGNVLETLVTGITSSSYNYNGAVYDNVNVTLEAERATIKSFQKISFTINRHGLGFKFGSEFGGVAP